MVVLRSVSNKLTNLQRLEYSYYLEVTFFPFCMSVGDHDDIFGACVDICSP